MAHPNGWGAHEQTFLRNAIVKAGLVPRPQAHDKVKVVSEGEASVHFVMVHGDFETRLRVSPTTPLTALNTVVLMIWALIAWGQLCYM